MAGVGGVDRGEVRRDADVRDDHAEIFRRDHLRGSASSTLATSSSVTASRVPGRRLEVDHELPGVGARKEREPEQREHREADRERDAEGRQREPRAGAASPPTSRS